MHIVLNSKFFAKKIFSLRVASACYAFLVRQFFFRFRRVDLKLFFADKALNFTLNCRCFDQHIFLAAFMRAADFEGLL